MGILQNVRLGLAYSLSTRTTIGRSSSNTIVLREASISGVHASIDWLDEGWHVRDLGSRNGTYLDGQRVDPFEAVQLGKGSQIAYGGIEDPWQLAHVEGPQIAARSDTGRLAHPTGDVLTLTGSRGDELTLIRDGQDWEYEFENTTRFALDQSCIDVGGTTWSLLVPEVLSETTLVSKAPSADELKLHFIPNRNEEHIQLQVDAPGVREHFDHRAHFYLLLTLARLRLEDAAGDDVPALEQGWIERNDLERLLRVDTQHLNLLVHRARRQFARIGVRDAAAIVERRTGSSQLRIGTADLFVVQSE